MKKKLYFINTIIHFRKRYISAILFIGISISLIVGITSIIEYNNNKSYQNVVNDTLIDYQLRFTRYPIQNFDFFELEEEYIHNIKNQIESIDTASLNIDYLISNASIHTNLSTNIYSGIQFLYLDPSTLDFKEFKSSFKINGTSNLLMVKDQILIDNKLFTNSNIQIGDRLNISRFLKNDTKKITNLLVSGSFQILNEDIFNQFLYLNYEFSYEENYTSIICFQEDILDIIIELDEPSKIPLVFNYKFGFNHSSNENIKNLINSVDMLDNIIRSKSSISIYNGLTEEYLGNQIQQLRQTMVILNFVCIGINIPLILLCFYQIHSIIDSILEDRMHEFVLLKIRKKKDKTIFLNLVQESVCISIIGGVFGIIFGETLNILYSFLEPENSISNYFSFFLQRIINLRNILFIFLLTPIITIIIYRIVFIKKIKTKIIDLLKYKDINSIYCSNEEFQKKIQKRNMKRSVILLFIFYTCSLFFNESYINKINDTRSLYFFISNLIHSSLIALMPFLIIIVLIFLIKIIQRIIPLISLKISSILQKWNNKPAFENYFLYSKASKLSNSKVIVVLLFLFCFINLFNITLSLQQEYADNQRYQNIGATAHFFFEGSLDTKIENIGEIESQIESNFDEVISSQKIILSKQISLGFSQKSFDPLFLGLTEIEEYLQYVNFDFIKTNFSSKSSLIEAFSNFNDLILVPNCFLEKSLFEIGERLSVVSLKPDNYGNLSKYTWDFTIIGSYEAMFGIPEFFPNSLENQMVLLSSINNINISSFQIDYFSLLLGLEENSTNEDSEIFCTRIENYLDLNYQKYPYLCLNNIYKETQEKLNLVLSIIQIEKIFLIILLVFSVRIIHTQYNQRNQNTYSLMLSRTKTRKNIRFMSNLNFMIMLALSLLFGIFLSLSIFFQFNIFIWDNIYDISRYQMKLSSFFTKTMLLENVLIFAVTFISVHVYSNKYFSKFKINPRINE